MKKQIKINLEKIFDKNFQLIKDHSFEMIVEELIKENPEAFDLNSGTVKRLYNEEDVELLENAKKNKKLIALFESAKVNLIPENYQVEGVKNDILNSLEIIKIEKFNGIPIKFPLFIYSNEHDCEAMNVYVYE